MRSGSRKKNNRKERKQSAKFIVESPFWCNWWSEKLKDSRGQLVAANTNGVVDGGAEATAVVKWECHPQIQTNTTPLQDRHLLALDFAAAACCFLLPSFSVLLSRGNRLNIKPVGSLLIYRLQRHRRRIPTQSQRFECKCCSRKWNRQCHLFIFVLAALILLRL